MNNKQYPERPSSGATVAVMTMAVDSRHLVLIIPINNNNILIKVVMIMKAIVVAATMLIMFTPVAIVPVTTVHMTVI